MRYAFRGAFAVLVLSLVSTALHAQAAAGATAGPYRIYAPAGKATSLLVLLPGYGGNPDSFDPSSGFTPSTLPARLAQHGVMTLVAVPNSETLYETDKALGALDSLVDRVVRQHGLPRERVAIGGFSSGGTGAVRYAQRCAQQKCRAVPRIAAVFAVDPPLDFERLYRSSQLIVQRNAPRSNLAEERRILETLRGSLGGTPDESGAAYRLHSAVLASAPDGGNARLLARTPIRLYTEPDVGWWMEQRNLDFHGMNSVDHAALINLLRVAGNDRAELIATTGKGFRPDGRRHPHSWSIVDEPELARWLLAALAPAN